MERNCWYLGKCLKKKSTVLLPIGYKGKWNMKKFFLYNLGTFAQFTCDFRRTGFSGKKGVRHLGSSFIQMIEVSQCTVSHLSDVPLINEIGRNGT